MTTTHATLEQALRARNDAYPNQPGMAMIFPEIHEWFEFEGNQRHASWDGKLWPPYSDADGKRSPQMYSITVSYGCGGTTIGGTFVLNGIVQTPQHMEWDSTYGREERNLRFCQAANAVILAKAGADHVLRWGTHAPLGLTCPPPLYPKLAPGLGEKTAYNACYTFGRELRATYPGLTEAEIDAAFDAWGASFVEDDPSRYDGTGLSIPYLVAAAGMTQDDVAAIMAAKPSYGFAEGRFSEPGWPVTPVFDTLREWGRFACHEGYTGKKYDHVPLVMGNAQKQSS